MTTAECLKQLPNCKLHSTADQSTDEDAWLAARTRGIGGSDVGAICGVSPFSSARQVYMSKTGQYAEALIPNEAARERMHFGHVLEPVVADEYMRRVGTKEGFELVSLNATVYHKDYKWALANIDRLIVKDGKIHGILECKTTGEYNDEEWESGEILLSYMYQLNWYLWILDLKFGAFACLVGGNKFYEYTIYRNDELLQDVIIPAAESFWNNNVRALVEPELQSTDTDFANSEFSDVVKNSEVVFDDDVTNDLANTVFECKLKIKELDATMEEAKNRLKDRLRNTEIGYTKDFVIKWSPRSQSRVNYTKLKTEFPEVYNAVLKKSHHRAMYVKGVK